MDNFIEDGGDGALFGPHRTKRPHGPVERKVPDEVVGDDVNNGATMTLADVRLLNGLHSNYKSGMEEKQIGYMARYRTIRRYAAASVISMMVLCVLGITFFIHSASQMSIPDAILYSTYTITSAGYGSIPIPLDNDWFLLFVVVYLYVGITLLAIVVAQTYQYFRLASQRAQHGRDKVEGARLGVEHLKRMAERKDIEASVDTSLDSNSEELASNKTSIDPVNHLMRQELQRSLASLYPDAPAPGTVRSQFYARCRQCLVFFRTTEVGRALKVFLFLFTILVVIAIGMSKLEGWTFLEAIYFATFSMFTVGYGDYAPTNTASKLYISLLLPLNILFTAVYLSAVAHFFVLFSNWNIRRIEANMLKARKDKMAMGSKLKHLVENVERVMHKVEEGQVEATKEVARMGRRRRQRIRELSNLSGMMEESEDDNSSPVGTAQQMIDTIHKKVKHAEEQGKPKYSNSVIFGQEFEKSSLLFDSIFDSTIKTSVKQLPSLALRILIEERLAKIVASDVAGFDSSSEIKDEGVQTLIFTTEAMYDIATKWHIPQLAQHAFLSVSMEALFFVGEHALLTKGASAFFELNTPEFAAIFTPFVVALGDADTMEGWLLQTQVEIDALEASDQKPSSDPESGDIRRQSQMGGRHKRHLSDIPEEIGESIKPRRVMKEPVDDYFPVNQGNATLLEHRAHS